MDKNPELQKQAKTGEIAIKGTKEPDIVSEPVSPAQVSERPLERDQLGGVGDPLTHDFARNRDLGDETDA